ncbi:hypothetical protein [Mucilaginibacter sp.]|uniref:hypothetical protein n=1 Tax=Mucilaginibacter sp. TaxID=1882438 RepID=UPI003D0C3CDC
MYPYNPKQKKIRGWKRRIKQLERWGESIKQPYLKYFLTESGRHTYERCYLSPFYRLDKRQPPLWFYKLIVAKFILAFNKWEQTFKELNIPHDLQLWLYDPAYISSEIICHKMKQPGEFKRFSCESDIERQFPFEWFANAKYDLTLFDWILADDELVHFESDLEYADFSGQDLFADGYAKMVQEDGTAYYNKRIGDIWIGRRRGLMNEDSKNVMQEYYPATASLPQRNSREQRQIKGEKTVHL